MEKQNSNEIGKMARVNELIRSGDTTREIEHEHTITMLMVMGDYFVELTLDKKSRELKGMEIKEDSETLFRYFGEILDSPSKAA